MEDPWRLLTSLLIDYAMQYGAVRIIPDLLRGGRSKTEGFPCLLVGRGHIDDKAYMEVWW